MPARPAERRLGNGRRACALLCGIAALAGCASERPADRARSTVEASAGLAESARDRRPVRSAAGARTGRTARDRPRVTSARLERALRSNPNSEADHAACRPATRQDRTRLVAIFGHTRMALFVCSVALVGRASATFDFQVLPNGCFVGHRRRPGLADYGCVR